MNRSVLALAAVAALAFTSAFAVASATPSREVAIWLDPCCYVLPSDVGAAAAQTAPKLAIWDDGRGPGRSLETAPKLAIWDDGRGPGRSQTEVAMLDDGCGPCSAIG